MKNSLKISSFGLILVILILALLTEFTSNKKEVTKNEINEGTVISIQEGNVTLKIKDSSDTLSTKECRIKTLDPSINLISCLDNNNNLHTITDVSPLIINNNNPGDIISYSLPDITYYTTTLPLNDIQGIPQIGHKVYINPKGETFSSENTVDDTFLCLTSKGLFSLNNNHIYYYQLNIRNHSNTKIKENILYSVRGSIQNSKSYGMNTLTITHLQEIKDNSFQSVYNNCQNLPSDIDIHFISQRIHNKSDILYYLFWVPKEYHVLIPYSPDKINYSDGSLLSYFVIGSLFFTGLWIYWDSFI